MTPFLRIQAKFQANGVRPTLRKSSHFCYTSQSQNFSISQQTGYEKNTCSAHSKSAGKFIFVFRNGGHLGTRISINAFCCFVSVSKWLSIVCLYILVFNEKMDFWSCAFWEFWICWDRGFLRDKDFLDLCVFRGRKFLETAF
jgi:hypothetical protein